MSVAILQKTQQLVALAKRGDPSALGQLCGVYAERVRRMVRLRMGPELRSQLESVDLVQDALIAALEDLGDFTYRHEGDFLWWLSKIAENRIRDHIDRFHAAKRDVRRQVRLDTTSGSSGDGQIRAAVPMITTTPSVVLSRREELDRLEQAMDRLKSEYREVLMLAKIEGLGHKEIANRLNKSPAAVAKLLSRAIVALANAFEKI
jgi:RNA polymerase sigma-70 factor (ECF subfamily)